MSALDSGNKSKKDHDYGAFLLLFLDVMCYCIYKRYGDVEGFEPIFYKGLKCRLKFNASNN